MDFSLFLMKTIAITMFIQDINYFLKDLNMLNRRQTDISKFVWSLKHLGPFLKNISNLVYFIFMCLIQLSRPTFSNRQLNRTLLYYFLYSRVICSNVLN